VNISEPMVDLGDKRLNNRFSQLINQFMKKPTASIPQACSNWKNTKAAYRFFSNKSVDPEEILRAHYSETQTRISKTTGVILVAQDTTDCDYSTHPKTRGLGYLQGEHLFGIKMHSALAISDKGTPLGLLSQKRWIRDIGKFGIRRMKGKEKRPMEAKESNRWLTTVRDVGKRIPKDKEVVVIGDRESDLYTLFALKRKSNIHLLVRAKHNRYLWGIQKRLFAKISSTEEKGILTISVQKTPQRRIREVKLSIRFTNVTLASKYGHGAIRLWALEAKEEKPPQGVSPISWILLTTVPVKTLSKAKTIIDWYTKRWLIERFHYTLKSGCRIEQLQLQEKERLERALSAYSIVAWRLLFMTYEAREHPDESYRKIVTDEEWEVLCATTNSSKKIPGTIYEAVRMIAKMGGFLGRKGDLEPGVKTLWTGILRLSYTMTGWYILKEKNKV
jgi:Transposase DNA-binding/Transposase Tn5 dimerisation domain